MALDATQDRWSLPCDLCGSLSFETVNAAGAEVQRCGDCGLISVTHGRNGNGARAVGHSGLRSSFTSLEQALLQAAGSGAQSVLLIGATSLPLVPAITTSGAEVTVLVEPDVEPPINVPAFASTVESAPFLPDQFDLIASARGLESFSSPALLFEKTRLWLVPGGIFLIGGTNWNSLAARLWRREWLRYHTPTARHLFTSTSLRKYADRYGYEVKSVHTYSRPGETVRVAVGDHQPSIVTKALLAPVTVASSVLGMGDELLTHLVKRGVAMHTLPSKAKAEPDSSPGLAPALYSGYSNVHKESDL